MELKQLTGMIKAYFNSELYDLTPFKARAILFMAQIDYYTCNGETLFKEDLYCFYDDIKISGFTLDVPFVELDTSLEALSIKKYCEKYAWMREEELLGELYQSKAFLRTNLSPGHRLTKKSLTLYHELYELSFDIDIWDDPLIDGIAFQDQIIDEIIDDLEVLN